MDNTRVNIRVSGISCGVFELSGITDPQGALYQIAGRLYHPSRGEPVAFCIWSDTENTNSWLLYKLIQDNKFGKVTISEEEENPKTGNSIVIMTWAINHENFKKWYAQQRVSRLKKVGTTMGSVSILEYNNAVRKVQSLTRMLCSVCTNLEQEGSTTKNTLYFRLMGHDPELYRWWLKHKEEDRVRIHKENVELMKKKEQEFKKNVELMKKKLADELGYNFHPKL